MPIKKKLTDIEKKSIIAKRSWVRFRLGLEGHTLRSLAKKHRITAGCLTSVFYHPYPKMEKLIADVLKIHPSELWPGRYDKSRKPNRINSRYKRSHNPINTTSGAEVNGKDFKKNNHKTVE